MNVLITPNYAAPYDRRMVEGLADGFKSIGHQAYALSSPISSMEVLQKCKKLPVDVVIQVNRTRDPEVDLPQNVRHISWFQDVFPGTMNGFADGFRESDILYALGDHQVLGLNIALPCYVGSLVTGVDKSILDYKKSRISNPMDFSLCGYIPPPLPRKIALWRSLLPIYMSYSVYKTMINTVQKDYTPLSGALDIHELSKAIRHNIARCQQSGANVKTHRPVSLYGLLGLGKLKTAIDSRLSVQIERAIDYFTREYPRLLDRVTLIDEVLQISDSLELHGHGWGRHVNFRPYSKGIIDTQNGLLDVYKRSKINLSNNTHGLGLHSRTLECMAVGGFIFIHASPHDSKPGGMLTSFEPGVHFGQYSKESLHEEASRWLKDDRRREQAGIQASKVIRERHCWHHRAQQIIDDLKR
jgi:hypothetical protein